MNLKSNGDLEWLAPLSFVAAGIPLTLIISPALLEQSGLVDRELARGLTTLFGIMLTLPSLIFWTATALLSAGALVWGRRGLRGRVLLWYFCLATTLLLLGMEQRVLALAGCIGLLTLMILPFVWLYLHTHGRKGLESV